jgi:hypothetical protein
LLRVGLLHSGLLHTGQLRGAHICLFWLSSYVARHCSAVAPQSGAKQNFYCTVYYIALRVRSQK